MPPRQRRSSFPLRPARWRASALPKRASATASTRNRCRISSRYAATLPDKLPGAAGVGPKGAADLIRRHGSLEGVLAAGRFATEAKALRLYRSIATMDATATLPTLPDQQPTWAKAGGLAREWELKRLAEMTGAEPA
jgi:hypothetical protein